VWRGRSRASDFLFSETGGQIGRHGGRSALRDPPALVGCPVIACTVLALGACRQFRGNDRRLRAEGAGRPRENPSFQKSKNLAGGAWRREAIGPACGCYIGTMTYTRPIDLLFAECN
jgi:hypothetical protein